jgi:GntR family transcriptional regulator
LTGATPRASNDARGKARERKAVATSTDDGDLAVFLRENARLDDDVSTALYRRLAEGLRLAIQRRMVRPGAAIPGERDLAQSLGVSRITVRKAVKMLVDEELLIQRHGTRTCVASRVEKPAAVFSSFSEDMEARGFRPGAVWLARSAGAAPPSEALALGLSPGERVLRLRRLRTADGMPMAIEDSVVPCTFIDDPDTIGESLYLTLETAGFVPVRALQRLRAVTADKEEARLLGVHPGAPLFDVERRVFLGDGVTVEYCRSRYRGDTYDFMMELNRRPWVAERDGA